MAVIKETVMIIGLTTHQANAEGGGCASVLQVASRLPPSVTAPPVFRVTRGLNLTLTIATACQIR